jgi:hypothetical protein
LSREQLGRFVNDPAASPWQLARFARQRISAQWETICDRFGKPIADRKSEIPQPLQPHVKELAHFSLQHLAFSLSQIIHASNNPFIRNVTALMA